MGYDIWYDQYTFQHYSNDMVNVFLHKNYSSNSHKHEFYEINIVASGSGTHIVDGTTYLCEKGDVFVVPPFISHQFISNGNLNVYNVMISTLWVKNFTNELDNLSGFYPLFSALPLFRSDGESTRFLHLNSEDYDLLDILLEQSQKMYFAKTAYPPFHHDCLQEICSFLSGLSLIQSMERIHCSVQKATAQTHLQKVCFIFTRIITKK